MFQSDGPRCMLSLKNEESLHNFVCSMFLAIVCVYFRIHYFSTYLQIMSGQFEHPVFYCCWPRIKGDGLMIDICIDKMHGENMIGRIRQVTASAGLTVFEQSLFLF